MKKVLVVLVVFIAGFALGALIFPRVSDLSDLDLTIGPAAIHRDDGRRGGDVPPVVSLDAPSPGADENAVQQTPEHSPEPLYLPVDFDAVRERELEQGSEPLVSGESSEGETLADVFRDSLRTEEIAEMNEWLDRVQQNVHELPSEVRDIITRSRRSEDGYTGWESPSRAFWKAEPNPEPGYGFSNILGVRNAEERALLRKRYEEYPHMNFWESQEWRRRNGLHGLWIYDVDLKKQAEMRGAEWRWDTEWE